MPSLVVDASAIVDLLTGAPARERIAARMLRPGDELHAPHSVDLEVAHAMQRLFRRQLVTEVDVERMTVGYRRMRIVRHAHTDLLPRIWQLRHNITAYDAAYVALAGNLGAPLITRDARLARSSGHRARIEHIA